MTIDWPSVLIPTGAQWELRANTQESRSPLSGAVQTYELPGVRWAATLNFDNMGEEEAAAYRKLIAQCRGRSQRVNVPFFPRTTPRGTGGGSPRVVNPQNLLLRSEEFNNAAWFIKSQVTALDAYRELWYSSTPGNPGNSYARGTLLTEDTNAGQHFISQLFASPTVAGTRYTFSVWVLPQSCNTVLLQFNNTLGVVLRRAYFNLTNGTVNSLEGIGTTATITAEPADLFGNIWYRCTISAVADITSTNGAPARVDIVLLDANYSYTYTGSGRSLIVFGAQVVAHNSALPYQKTIASEVHTGQNLLLQSETFGSVWSNVAATISADVEGNADKLVEDTSNGQHYISQYFTIIPGRTYTLSFLAKAAGRTQVWVSFNNEYLTYSIQLFDLSTLTVPIGQFCSSSSVTAVDSTWRLCVATFTIPSYFSAAYPLTISLQTAVANNPSYTGDGTSGVLLNRIQVREGTVVDDYQLTTSVAAAGQSWGLGSRQVYVDGIVPTGAAVAGGLATLTLASNASSVDDAYNGMWLRVQTGIGLPQDRQILDYVGSTKVATVSPGWRSNLCLHSETLTLPPWALLNTPILTCPDGTSAGGVVWTGIQDNDAALYEGVTQNIAVPNDSGTYAVSWLVRKTTGGTSKTFGAYLALNGGTNVTNSPRINTDTGAVLLGSVSVEDLGDAWRCTANLANNSSGNTVLIMQFYPSTGSYNSAVDDVTQTGTARVGGFHVRLSAGNSEYIKTAGSGILNPRRPTNQVLYSDQFDNASWLKVGASFSVTPNATTAPDGTMTADLLDVVTSDVNAYVRSVQTGAISGRPIGVSVWAKAQSADHNISVGVCKEGDSGVGVFTITAITAASWTRISVSGIANSGSSSYGVIIQNQNSLDGIYVWRARMELMLDDTGSDVQTTSAPVTAPDVLLQYEILQHPTTPLTWLKTGDVIKLGDELKLLTEDAVVDKTGHAIVSFEPPLRGYVAQGVTPVIVNPTAQMILEDSTSSWSVQPAGVHSATLTFVEAWNP